MKRVPHSFEVVVTGLEGPPRAVLRPRDEGLCCDGENRLELELENVSSLLESVPDELVQAEVKKRLVTVPAFCPRCFDRLALSAKLAEAGLPLVTE